MADTENPDFSPYFKGIAIDSATTPVYFDFAQRLRYEVYCLECRFLPAEEYPNCRESDDRDSCSAHFGALNHAGEFIGYVRLVGPDAKHRFPFQDFCTNPPTISLPPAPRCMEISRLMVRKDYRRRKGDNLAGVAIGADTAQQDHADRRGQSPQIMLSLYRQMYLHSQQQGIRYWYASMERQLARTLRLMGFCFQQFGPETDYFGPVAPYIADLRELESQVQKTNPDLLKWMRRPDEALGIMRDIK